MKDILLKLEYYILKLLIGLKSFWLWALSLLASFFAPIGYLIFTAFILAVFDMIIAITAVYIKEGRRAITSKGMEGTYIKLTLYALLITVVHFIDIIFLDSVKVGFIQPLISDELYHQIDKMKLSVIAGVLIASREGLSIDENWRKIFGWGLLDTVTVVTNYIKNRGKSK